MSEENKATFRKLIEEGFVQGNTAVVDELVGANIIDHSPMPGQGPGSEGLKDALTMFRGAFPDLQVTIEDMIAEGEKVVVRVTMRGTHQGEFMGIPATNKKIEIARCTSSGSLEARWSSIGAKRTLLE